MGTKKLKLGKPVKLKYIPFSELIDPHKLQPPIPEVITKGKGRGSIDSIPFSNSRALNTIKVQDIQALISSIKAYGLLNPFSVVDITKEGDWKIDGIETKEFAEGKYAIVDGQRRFLALRKIIQESKYSKSLHLVLIPCLVYPYTSFKEMTRHSVEDNKFSIRPDNLYLDVAERR